MKPNSPNHASEIIYFRNQPGLPRSIVPPSRLEQIETLRTANLLDSRFGQE